MEYTKTLEKTLGEITGDDYESCMKYLASDKKPSSIWFGTGSNGKSLITRFDMNCSITNNEWVSEGSTLKEFNMICVTNCVPTRASAVDIEFKNTFVPNKDIDSWVNDINYQNAYKSIIEKHRN